MGFFSRLGHKITREYHRVGGKVSHEVHRVGNKIGHREQIKSIAHKVADIAGKTGKITGYAAKGLALAGGVVAATGVGAPIGGALEVGAAGLGGFSKVMKGGALAARGVEALENV